MHKPKKSNFSGGLSDEIFKIDKNGLKRGKEGEGADIWTAGGRAAPFREKRLGARFGRRVGACGERLVVVCVCVSAA